MSPIKPIYIEYLYIKDIQLRKDNQLEEQEILELLLDPIYIMRFIITAHHKIHWITFLPSLQNNIIYFNS